MKTDAILAGLRAGKAPQIGTRTGHGGRQMVRAMAFNSTELLGLLQALAGTLKPDSLPGFPSSDQVRGLARLERRLQRAVRGGTLRGPICV